MNPLGLHVEGQSLNMTTSSVSVATAGRPWGDVVLVTVCYPVDVLLQSEFEGVLNLMLPSYTGT